MTWKERNFHPQNKGFVPNFYFFVPKPHISSNTGVDIHYRHCNDFNGATERSRTADLLITNQLLYQLSYDGTDTILLGNREMLY